MNNSKQTPTVDTARIEKFSHDGRGITRISGKTTFIQNALPDETVTFKYIRKKRDYDEGIALSIETPSTHRVAPRCPHYTLCGGCSMQHLDEAEQIHVKQSLLLDLLARTGHCQPNTILEPLTSNAWHYRHKARLSVRFVEKKQSVLIGFREKNNPRYITEIDECPVLHASVDAQIKPLRRLIESFDDPRSIAQIEVAAGDEDIALIIRHLSPLSASDKDKLRAFSEQTRFQLYLQPGGEDSVHRFFPTDAPAYLTYALPDYGVEFKFYPTDFTQINAGLNRRMVVSALNLLELGGDDTVLDLFCGLGNFSLPMATQCASVVGVEGSQAMVERASMNAAHNGITNAHFLCHDLTKTAVFDAFKPKQFSHLLLDPPRVGAFDVVKEIDRIRPKRLVYISCNPATLARDADVLVNQKGYRLQASGVMDMFPHTAHVESIALFEDS